MTALAQHLREIRESFLLSPQEMAEIMGTSLRQYMRYESDECAIPSHQITRLKRKMDLDLNWLFTGQGDLRSLPDIWPYKFVCAGLSPQSFLEEFYSSPLRN